MDGRERKRRGIIYMGFGEEEGKLLQEEENIVPN